MALEPIHDGSEFAESAEAVRDNRERAARTIRGALDRVAERFPEVRDAEVADVSRGFEGILHDLDIATEELRVQGEALFAARVDLDSSSAFFRDLFELAPCAYLVTDLDGRIAYANQAASQLLGAARNTLTGKLLAGFVPPDGRSSFHSALLRSCSRDAVVTWPLLLSSAGNASYTIPCRARVSMARPNEVPTPRRMLFWNIFQETDEDFF